MTKIGFYHLTATPLDKALPKLLEKILSSDMRAIVLVNSAEQIEQINRLLWIYNPHGFLPHGTKEDGYEKYQPIYITDKQENPNNANVVVLPYLLKTNFINDFERCLLLFDGNNDVEQARSLWKEYKTDEHDLKYWKQTEQGSWTS